MDKKTGPRILFIDIETAPVLAWVFQLFDQNIGLNQIKKDWHLMSFAAKWKGDPPSKVIYMDQRHKKNIEDDREMCQALWALFDEADIIIGQNSRRFDVKKVNARFLLHGMKPPSSYRQIDTLVIAKKHFAMTSNKLEYTSEKLCTKYPKLKHKKFPGFELWRECMAGNLEAWEEMRKYNIRDTLSTEEYYEKLAPWDNSINFDVYHKNHSNKCGCGSTDLIKYGFRFTNAGKFQRLICNDCGKEMRSPYNEFSTKKKKSLLK